MKNRTRDIFCIIGLVLSIVILNVIIISLREGWLYMDYFGMIQMILSVIGTVAGVFIGSFLEKRRSIEMMRKEVLYKNNFDNWLEISLLIKRISNDCQHILRKSELFAKRMDKDKEDILYYKEKALDSTHTINNELLEYHNLLEKVDLEDKKIYDDFYQYILDKIYKNEAALLKYADDLIKLNYAPIFQASLCADNKLLDSIIKETQAHIDAAKSSNVQLK